MVLPAVTSLPVHFHGIPADLCFPGLTTPTPAHISFKTSLPFPLSQKLLVAPEGGVQVFCGLKGPSQTGWPAPHISFSAVGLDTQIFQSQSPNKLFCRPWGGRCVWQWVTRGFGTLGQSCALQGQETGSCCSAWQVLLEKRTGWGALAPRCRLCVGSCVEVSPCLVPAHFSLSCPSSVLFPLPEVSCLCFHFW